MAATVHQILQDAYPEYARTHPVAAYVRRAMWWVLRCATGDLGVFVRRCPRGHLAEVAGRSCRHRSCPACRAGKAMRWLDRCAARILPARHFHVILTIASELHALWRHNRKRMAALLFAASRDSLMELLADPKYLGAVPGIQMALHDWSRSMSWHPHTHNLVSAGGIDANGRWKPVTRDFLLPGAVLRKVFRGKFTDMVEKGWQRGDIELPPGWDEAKMRQALRRARRKKWNVRIEAPYAHGKGVVNYLARYVVGGPIGSSRIRSFDGDQVVFEVGREEKDPTTMKLSAEQFVRRWIEHIPEPGLHMVRAYGLYSSARKKDRESCRAQMPAPPSEPAQAVTGHDDKPCCPICGEPMIIEQADPPWWRRRPSWLAQRRGPPEQAPGQQAEAA